MIFILQTSKPHYRLRSYKDFVDRFPRHYADVRFYGQQYDGLRDAPPHIIPHFHEGMPLDEVITKYIGEEPEAIFLFSSSHLSRVGHTDFRKFNCPLFCLFTDAPSWDDLRIAAMKQHTMKPFKALLHNYLHKLPELKEKVPAANYVLYPCWAAHCYDSEVEPADKNLEFLISGVPGGDEYTHRDIFERCTRGQGLSLQAGLAQRVNIAEDNERFRKDLLRSKYSPHDGGINGRLVPRYAESGFARSVPISPDLGDEMRRAGWEHNENCILFDREQYGCDESLQLLQDTAKRGDWHDLSTNAYELVRNRHCTDARISHFLEMALS